MRRRKWSWQSYDDDHLMCEIDGNHLTSAAIIGHDSVVRAQNPNFPQFEADEIAAVIEDIEEQGKLASTGLHLGGTKDMVIQGESGAVIRERSPGGVTVEKTNQALLIGIYEEPMRPGQCNMVVERIGDYLI